VVIELLKFQVPPEEQHSFIHKDAQIWTTALAKYPGFISKEIWLNPDEPSEITLIIRWATRQEWKAIPEADLIAIDQEFGQALGKYYPIVQAAEYHIVSR
jgi:uncharacterized protein (TIGR03792 family)